MTAKKALRDFVKGGVVLEGRGPKLAAAAFAIMTATAAPAAANDAAPLRDPNAQTVSAEAYREIVGRVRAEVEAAFPGEIFIVDRSADPRAEAARLGKAVGVPAAYARVGVEVDELGGEPHSRPFQGTRKGVCLVVGADPHQPARAGLILPPDMPTRYGALDEVTAHYTVLWHEVGHCLVGDSEAKADAFGALKMMATTKSTRSVEFMTVAREMNEWLGTKGDDHLVSPALRYVTARYGNDGFMRAEHSLAELAKIADKTPEPDMKRTTRIRDALARNTFSPDQRYFVPVKEGYVATSMYSWLKASRSVPEFARIIELDDYLTGDPDKRVVPPPFEPKPEVSAKAVAALAAAGDPMARRIAPAFGAKAASADAPVAGAGDLPPAERVPGRTIAFDRAAAVVKFTRDFRGFLVREAGTNRPVLAGDGMRGVTRTFGPENRRTKLEIAEDRAPRPPGP